MSSLERCSICEKSKGTCLCVGCKTYFCETHFNELDELVEDRNDLQDKINNIPKHSKSNDLHLAQIDEWEQKTIEKIKQAAEQARQKVSQTMNFKRDQMKKQFEKMSQELIQYRETKDFDEQDLTQLKQAMHQLHEDLKQLAESSAVEVYVAELDQIILNQPEDDEDESPETKNEFNLILTTGNHLNKSHHERLKAEKRKYK
jgi:anaerobic selenocysteine-containing dehydrogenase